MNEQEEALELNNTLRKAIADMVADKAACRERYIHGESLRSIEESTGIPGRTLRTWAWKERWTEGRRETNMDWKRFCQQVILPVVVAVPTTLGMLWWLGLLN